MKNTYYLKFFVKLAMKLLMKYLEQNLSGFLAHSYLEGAGLDPCYNKAVRKTVYLKFKISN